MKSITHVFLAIAGIMCFFGMIASIVEKNVQIAVVSSSLFLFVGLMLIYTAIKDSIKERIIEN